MERRAYLALSATALAALTGCSTDDAATTDTTTETTTTATTTTTETATTATTTTTETATDTTTTTTETTGTMETTTTATTTRETTAAARDSITVTVGPDGNLRFAPETFRLVAGGTVTWEWESGGHNVKPSSMPAGSDWEGTAGGQRTTFSSGHTHERTFDAAGEYEYYCAPHRNFGMTGSFTVE